MQIVSLKWVLDNKTETLGSTICFVDDLRDYKHFDIKYMVVKNGILDLNHTWDIIVPTPEMEQKEVCWFELIP